MSFRPTPLDDPFRVHVARGRFAGTVGTAVARFNDGVLVVVPDGATDLTDNAFPRADEVERLDNGGAA
jgi:hypothetical protein